MLLKLLFLPFSLVKKAIGFVFFLIKMVMALITGLGRFAVTRVFGAVFGALFGALLGRKHVGVKIFPKK